MHTKIGQGKKMKNFQKKKVQKVQKSEGLDLAFAFSEQYILFENLIFLLKKKSNKSIESSKKV